ncbi:MAG: hypothetical protein RL026_799 [Pseudomonadota bacterium]
MSSPVQFKIEERMLDLDSTVELPVMDPRLAKAAATATDHTQIMPLPDFPDPVLDETVELRVLPESLLLDLPDDEEPLQAPVAAPAQVDVPRPAMPTAPATAATGTSSSVIALLERNLHELAERLASRTQRVTALEADLAQVREELGGRLDSLQSEYRARQNEDARRLADAAAREAALKEELAQSRRAAQEQREALESRIGSLAHTRAVAEQQQALLARELAQHRHAAERHLEQLRHLEGRRQLGRAAFDDQAAIIVSLQAQLAAQAARHEAASASLDAERAEVERQVVAGARAMAELARERTELLAEVAALRSQLASRDERLAAIEAQSEADAAALVNLQRSLETLGVTETLAPASPPDDRPLIAAQPVFVWEEDGQTREQLLGARTTLGRTDDNDIVLDATFASRHHAVVLREGGRLRIEDLNSTNGLRVNGHRVMHQLLHDGDVITIGKTVFRCVYRIVE